jgi:uracil-DNA glycosylase
MRWTERQCSMIEAMGIRLYSLPGAGLAMEEEAQTQALPERPPEPSLPLSPGIATDGAIAQMDWPALRAAVAGCRACGLCESRKNTVFGVGHEQAHWMIVGEAPGENEDLQGEPFVGAAGALLDNMLRALGLTRQADAPERQVFIANTLKCRPPRNRNPEPAETAQCAPYLARQIELVQPRVLLAMGRFAAQALLQTDEPIGRLRGRVHRWRDTPVVVTYHPAYLLRTLADKARAWEDLCLAASVVQQHEA